jgi:hypothetical protein
LKPLAEYGQVMQQQLDAEHRPLLIEALTASTLWQVVMSW